MTLFTFQLRIVLLLMLAASRPVLANGTNHAPNPVTARDFFNAGTRLLTTNNFVEAERMFQSALGTQDERVRPLALFNLGHTRFAAGGEILKKGPNAQKVTAQGNSALAAGGQAFRTAELALAESELTKMVNAYLEGRGARRQLRAAEKAVQSALDAYGNTLRKWQRAADDFHGTAELNPADTNALHNAKLVEQNIAKLVDSMRQMQQMAGKIGDQKKQLDQQLSQLKGQIPAPNAPPGDSGEEDEEEGVQPDLLKGKTENAGREGEQFQVPLSPDQAGQMLDGISLDGSRRLPMSDKEGAKPKDKAGRNW